VSLDCRNTALSWEKAFNLAENDCITRETIALTTIIQVAGRIQAEFCVNIKEENIDAELINILLTYFPIMRVKKKDWDLLIDMNELLFQKELFIELFRQDIYRKPDTIETNEPVNEPVVGETVAPDGDGEPKLKAKRGRKALWVKFPTLIECATEFIKQHSHIPEEEKAPELG